jgi:hypothetical protein
MHRLDPTALASPIIRRRMSQAASEIVKLLVTRADSGRIAPRDLAKLVSLQPLVLEAVRIAFGRAMEDELRELYASGRAKVPARAHKARRRGRS